MEEMYNRIGKMYPLLPWFAYQGGRAPYARQASPVDGIPGRIESADTMATTLKVPTQPVYGAEQSTLRQVREQLIVRLTEHTSLSHVDVRSTADGNEMLLVIIEQVRRLLGAEGVVIASFNVEKHETVVELAGGIWANLCGQRVAGSTDLNTLLSHTPYPSASVPLVAQGQSIGTLSISCASCITESNLRVLAAMADIAANALYSRQCLDRERQTAYDVTLEGWVHALELRDSETKEHTKRVTAMTVSLARAMGVSEVHLVHVRRGALLHDIGKIAIPDSILLKPGPLTDAEWKIMREHPHYAHSMLAPIPFLQPALDIPLYHHEKWDGTGYPFGLKGEQIPWAARIFAVVDVWDALRFDRPYRKAWLERQVRKHIVSLAGTHFDPDIVHIFMHHMDENPQIFSCEAVLDHQSQDNHPYPYRSMIA